MARDFTSDTDRIDYNNVLDANNSQAFTISFFARVDLLAEGSQYFWVSQNSADTATGCIFK